MFGQSRLQAPLSGARLIQVIGIYLLRSVGSSWFEMEEE